MNLNSRKVNRSGLRISHSKVFSSELILNQKDFKKWRRNKYLRNYRINNTLYSVYLIKLFAYFYIFAIAGKTAKLFLGSSWDPARTGL